MEKTYTVICPDEQKTMEFGRQLAQIARIGDCFALFGTLGMGKSVLARSFIQTLTGAQEVPSPTFTLVQSYETPGFEIYHFDLYRIKSPDEIFELGMEEALYQGVCIIEWPEKMAGYLPRDVFRVNITPFETGRKIEICTTSEEKYHRLLDLKAL